MRSVQTTGRKVWATHPAFLVLPIFVLVLCAAKMRPGRETRAAVVLFEGFETIFRADSDLVSSYPGSYRMLSKNEANRMRAPYGYLLAGLEALGKGPARDTLVSTEAVLVGAKDFRAPTGLGSVQSQVCYVLVLRQGTTFNVSKYFHVAATASVAGIPVFPWTAEYREFEGEAPVRVSFYAAQIDKDFLLVSNDFEELRWVGERLSSSTSDVARLEEIREWKTVSQERFWGYRRYRHNQVLDFSNKAAAGMTHVTPSAQALIFVVDFQKKGCTLRLLTSTNDGETATKY